MKFPNITGSVMEANSNPPAQATTPLVSIICFCMNRVSSIARCVESVLNQSYANIEFVVQDGASTDGTLEILRAYADRDSRLKLVSEPDAGYHEAFLKVLRRCKGDVIGCCLSDEELLPNAVATAVQLLSTVPNAAAITCDGYICDSTGNVTGEFIAGDFDIVNYLFGRYCPFYPGSFFRRQALEESGLLGPDFSSRCLEFEIWRRLGVDCDIRYFPVPMSKYGIHGAELSHNADRFNEYLDAKSAVIENMFSADGFFSGDERLKIQCLINHTWQTYNHAKAYKIDNEAVKLAARIRTLEEMAAGVLSPPGEMASLPGRYTSKIWLRIATHTPPRVRRCVPIALKMRVWQFFGDVDHRIHKMSNRLAMRIQRKRPVANSQMASVIVPEIPAPPILPTYYRHIAALYESRGQIRQALDLLARAEVLNDPTVDTIMNYTILKEPRAGYEDIREIARHWARRHAKPIYGKGEPKFTRLNGNRKIRLAYHCSWMDSYVFEYIMGGAIRSHDRSRFEVFGYSYSPIPKRMEQIFDRVWRVNTLSDTDFVDKVRQDQIDVFVEISGFSQFSRFSAMASRCAPVQVSYVNHTGTTEIPNVDYVIADEICLPSDGKHDLHFSEAIYRLPSCFLCYDYENVKCPPVADPPFLKTKQITFACFGTGSKINATLIGWWAKILDRVPGSIMYVRNPQLDSKDNRRYMQRLFRKFGIGAERLRLEGGTDWLSIMEAYAEVDIALDTWPYNGGNSVAEPLWQGVPVVTFTGDRFSSRYGSSLVDAAGCGDLIGNSPEEYISIATSLAGDADRLIRLRHNLRKMCKENGLGDSQRLARVLDAAYVDMISRYWKTH